MGRTTIPPALIELSNPTSPEAQVNALRNLRNEVVGHDQRKELAVVHGVVKPLAGILRTEARKGGKRRRGVANGNATSARNNETGSEWNTEDELRFQATQVVGSLVNGGPAFVAPLLQGDIFPPLLETLSPTEVPSKLILATLRTLNQIADAVAQEKPWLDTTDTPLSSSLSSAVYEHIYTKSVVESLAGILSQHTSSLTVQQQISLTSKLIAKTCQEGEYKKLLFEAGILDLLAVKLAAMAAVDAQALRLDSRSSLRDELPVMYLSDILEAISAIIRDSHYHTARFLYSQPIQQLFGSPKDHTGTFSGFSSNLATPWDKLTPRLQTMQNKSDAYGKSWPALGAYNSTNTSESFARLPGMDTMQTTSRTVITEESENPLFIWLMFVARRGEGKARLSACWLLALLKKFGDKWPLNDPSKTTRERHFAYLVVPLVVKMIEDSNPESEQSKRINSSSPQAQDEHRFVLERAPLVLAELVAGNKTLQNAAVDTRFLSTLARILKRSFEPIGTAAKPMWSPNPSSKPIRDSLIDQSSSTLGSPGLSTESLHVYRYRESILLALAALADTQDGLRKQIIEIGAATYIIDSLVPYPIRSTDASAQNAGSTIPKGGNPIAVLIAACKLTRSLSRSVSVLRTSLIDHGIAKPCFDLLTHPNVKVQIAATEVITNLVLEVSPMRNEIIQAGALKILCEHCRSADFDLRYGSLWALKHLCLSLSYTTKIQCLDELGVGWLVQTLNGEPGKGSTSASLGMGTPNAAGEQVDILNAIDDPHMDVDDEGASDDDDETMAESIPSMRRHQRPGSRYTSATNIRERLQQIKNDEQDVRLSNERDDIRIQEQALDFIRNFINDEKEGGPMIDHCLKSFGNSRFFELLDAKIRPKGVLNTQSGSPSYWNNTPQRNMFTASNPALSTPNFVAYPPTELVIGTLYILVHLANGPPKHRQLLISQTQLMQHVLPLLSHPRRDVRLPCAWFINNLTWVEDSNDDLAARERAQMLRQLGFEEGARLLGRDVDLDIRERAKTAVEQMTKLLSDGRSVAGSVFGGDGSGVSGLSRVGGLHSHRGWGRDGGGGGV
ncbi:armadillo-type protein [Dendryphion nanum]|uniref:Armadillo-type protein n=1 Tax=Dendryphion nanum TaxID=256645 RepID=A0A9P9IG02_9PLEO|nr:armadillo-type protein [Dendryphion nanum]